MNIFQLGASQLFMAGTAAIAHRLGVRYGLLAEHGLEGAIGEMASHAAVGALSHVAVNQVLLPEEDRPSVLHGLGVGAMEGLLMGGVRAALHNRMGLLSMAAEIGGSKAVGQVAAGTSAIARYLNLGERKLTWDGTKKIASNLAHNPIDTLQALGDKLRQTYEGSLDAWQTGLSQKAASRPLTDLFDQLHGLQSGSQMSPEATALKILKSGIAAQEHLGAERLSLGELVEDDHLFNQLFGVNNKPTPQAANVRDYARKLIAADERVKQLAVDRYIFKNAKGGITDARDLAMGPARALRHLQNVTQVPFVGVSPLKLLTGVMPQEVGEDFAFRKVAAGMRSYLRVTPLSADMRDRLKTFTTQQLTAHTGVIEQVLARDPLAAMQQATHALQQDPSSMAAYYLHRQTRSEQRFLSKHLRAMKSLDDEHSKRLAARMEEGIKHRADVLSSLPKDLVERGRRDYKTWGNAPLGTHDQSFARTFMQQLKADMTQMASVHPNLPKLELHGNKAFGTYIDGMLGKTQYTNNDVKSMFGLRRDMFREFEHHQRNQRLSPEFMTMIRAQIEDTKGLSEGAYQKLAFDLKASGEHNMVSLLEKDIQANRAKAFTTIGRTTEDQYLIGKHLVDEYGNEVARGVVADDSQLARLFYGKLEDLTDRAGRKDMLDDLRRLFDVGDHGMAPSIFKVGRSWLENLNDPRHGMRLFQSLEEGRATDPESRHAVHRLIGDMFDRSHYSKTAVQEALGGETFLTHQDLQESFYRHFTQDVIDQAGDHVDELAKTLKMKRADFAQRLNQDLYTHGERALHEHGLMEYARQSDLWTHFRGMQQDAGYLQGMAPFDEALPNLGDILIPFKESLMPELKTVPRADLVARDMAVLSLSKQKDLAARIASFQTQGAQELAMFGMMRQAMRKNVTRKLVEDDILKISGLLQSNSHFKEIFQRRTEDLHTFFSVEIKNQVEFMDRYGKDLPGFAIIHEGRGLVTEANGPETGLGGYLNHVMRSVGLIDEKSSITREGLGRFGRQFAGRSLRKGASLDPENYSTITAGAHFLTERLNRFLEPIGMGLGPESTRTPYDMMRNLFLKRILPGYVAYQSWSYLNDKMRVPGTALEGGVNAGVSKLIADAHLAASNVSDRFGLTALHRGILHTLPGAKNVLGLGYLPPPFSGMEPGMDHDDLLAWYKRGHEVVRKGRFWMASSTPFAGGKIERFSENRYNRDKNDAHRAFMGPEYWRHNYAFPNPDNFFGLSLFSDALFNREGLYHYENKFRYSRPTVLSGGLFDNIPVIGPQLNMTVGQILKPTILTHPEETIQALQTAQLQTDLQRRQQAGELPYYVLARVPNTAGTKLKGKYLPVDPHLLAQSIVQQNAANEAAQAGGAGGAGMGLAMGGGTGGAGGGGTGGAGGGAPGMGAHGDMGFLSAPGGEFGGLSVPGVSPLGAGVAMGGQHMSAVLQQAYYQSTELAGIYGFYANTALDMEDHIKRISTANYDNWNKRFYDEQLGGQFYMGYGTSFSELFRRVIPRQKGEVFNPLPNDMPSWMAGSKRKFEEGDPYSKMPLGEERLPGVGWEGLHPNMLPQVRGSMMGKSQEEIEAFLRGEQSVFSDDFQERILDRGTQMHRAFQQEMKKRGKILQAELAIYDEKTGISGRIDAIFNDGTIMDLKSTSLEKLNQMTEAKPENISQLNFYLHVMGKKRGELWYQAREDLSQMKKFSVHYDPELLKRDLAKIEAAKRNVLAAAASGAPIGNNRARYEAYGDAARLQILADVAPDSLEYLKLRNYVKSHRDKYSTADLELIDRTLYEAEKRSQAYTFTPYRFRDNDLATLKVTVQKVLSPTSFIAKEYPGVPISLAGLSVRNPETLKVPTLFKEGQVFHAKVAKPLNQRVVQGVMPAYLPGINEKLLGHEDVQFTNTGHPSEIYAWNPLQHAIGKAWEEFAHLNTPVHNMFARNRSALEEFERSRVYGKDFKDWRHPIRDYVKPMLEGFGQMNPLAAAAMGGLFGGGYQFLPKGLDKVGQLMVGGGFVRDKAARPFGAILGAAIAFGYSMMTHAKKAALGAEATMPEETKKTREVEEYFDNLEYVKYKRLRETYKYMADSVDDRTVSQAFQSEMRKANLRMGKTLRGLDVENAAPATMKRAFYTMDKPFFESFAKAPDSEKKRILELLPAGERRAMQKLYGQKVEELPSLESYFHKHFLPGEEWEGWRPEVDLQAVKLQVVKSMGLNPYSVDYFSDVDSHDAVEPIEDIHGRGDRYSSRDEREKIEDQLRSALAAHGLDNLDVSVEAHEGDDHQVSMDVAHDRTDEVDGRLSSLITRWFN